MELACSVAGGLLMFAGAMWVLNFITAYWLEGRSEKARRRAMDEQYEREERAKLVPARTAAPAAAVHVLPRIDVEAKRREERAHVEALIDHVSPRIDGEAKRRRIEEAEARIARQTLPADMCPKRRDRGAHERGDRGKCLYCDSDVAEAVPSSERWWCLHCDARVPSTDKLCARCGHVPQWR